MLTTDALLGLGEALRAKHFAVSTQQYIAAGLLLARLISSGGGPTSPHQLAPYLGPIFCTSAEEQDRFNRIYAEWVAQMFPGQAPPEGDPGSGEQNPEPPPPPSRWWVALLGLVLVVAAVAWDGLRSRDFKAIVTSVQGPVEYAELRIDKDPVVVANERGEATIPFRRWRLPLRLDVSQVGFVPTTKDIESLPAGAVQISLSLPPPPPPPTEPIVVPPPPAQSPLDARRLYILPEPATVPRPPVKSKQPEIVAWHIGMILAPVLLAAAWLTILQARRRGWLDRLPRANPELAEHLRSETAQPLRAMSSALHSLGRSLRRRRFIASGLLDVPATIRATLQRGGYPQPVFRSHVEPGYVVLIDRMTFGDHQALLADEIVRSLLKQDVAIEWYSFRGDPHHVWRPRPVASGKAQQPQVDFLELSEIQGHYGDRRLLVFSDGRGLLDPYSWQPRQSLIDLEIWEQRVLLTPVEQVRWGGREAQLERAGLVVLPLSAVGLHVLGEILSREALGPQSPREASGATHPLYLREDNRLLDRIQPDNAYVDALITELEHDLGPIAFAWLCGCAVYPAVHWGITLRVGRSVVTSDEQLAKLLPALARLPWLRESFLPDWFRDALLSRLGRHDAIVRAALDEFLRQLSNQPNDEIPLKLAIAEAGSWREWWRDVRRGLFGPGLRESVLDDADRDLVFLRFMSGPKSRRSVFAPEWLRRLFFDHGAPLAGVRWKPISLGATLLAAGLAVLLPPKQPATNFIPSSPTAPAVGGLDVSSDGRRAVVWDRAGGIVLYELSEGQFRELWSERGGNTKSVDQIYMNGEDEFVAIRAGVGVAIRYDSAKRAWAADSGRATPTQWASTSGTSDARDPLRPMAIAPTGEERLLCSAYDSETGILVNVGARYVQELIRDGVDRPATPTGCGVAKDHGRIVVALDDRGLVAVDLRTRKVQTLTASTVAPVRGLAISNDGETILATRSDGSVLVLRAGGRSEDEIPELGASGPIGLSADGQTLAFATAGDATEVWSLDKKVAPRNVFVGIGIDESVAGRRGSPRADAAKLSEVLKARYGFEPLLAEDTSKDGILALLEKTAQQVRPEDRVILFVAGAGGVVPNTRDVQVFTSLTSGGKPVRPAKPIKASEIAEWAARLPAREVLTILHTPSAAVAFNLPKPAGTYGAKIRTMLASSAEGEVAVDSDGVSPFAEIVYGVLATTRAKGLRGNQMARAISQTVALETVAANTEEILALKLEALAILGLEKETALAVLGLVKVDKGRAVQEDTIIPRSGKICGTPLAPSSTFERSALQNDAVLDIVLDRLQSALDRIATNFERSLPPGDAATAGPAEFLRRLRAPTSRWSDLWEIGMETDTANPILFERDPAEPQVIIPCRPLPIAAKYHDMVSIAQFLNTTLAALEAPVNQARWKALRRRASELSGEIINKFTTPSYGSWDAAGHSGGDFLLIPRGPAIPPLRPLKQQPTLLSPIAKMAKMASPPRDQSATDLSVFRDCPTCPEMVVIPGGTFDMGAPKSEKDSSNDKRPVHAVTVRQFALGKYEVTEDEWQACVSEGPCQREDAFLYGQGRQFEGKGRHPVIDVSHGDATRYVEWLSAKTRQTYRLPSESEWEYAARGGTTTRWYWGDDEAQICQYGNVYDETIKRERTFRGESFKCEDGFVFTAPVGTFRANPYRLHDMIGNVWEWTEDCWKDTYREAPKDGSARREGECFERVVRGGSWSIEPQYSRSAMRGGFVTNMRVDFVGLRVARTLP